MASEWVVVEVVGTGVCGVSRVVGEGGIERSYQGYSRGVDTSGRGRGGSPKRNETLST